MCVLSVWYVILEHEDKNVRAELIWRVLIATIKMPIRISQSKFSFHNAKKFETHHRLWENRPLRAQLQNRVIGIQG